MCVCVEKGNQNGRILMSSLHLSVTLRSIGRALRCDAQATDQTRRMPVHDVVAVTDVKRHAAHVLTHTLNHKRRHVINANDSPLEPDVAPTASRWLEDH